MKTFRGALPPSLIHVCYDGKRALKGEHRDRVTNKDAWQFTISINLDEALQYKYPNKPRWDYGLGMKNNNTPNERVFWVEVHPASDSSGMLKKIRWLKNWIHSEAAKFLQLDNVFIWISTSGGSPRHHLRELKQAGLKPPRQKIELP